MTDANWFFGLGVVVASSISSFLGAYFRRRGEDVAALKGIEKLTATVENIKAAISDDVWDRQKQWEMRRDAVSDAWRALRELETSLINLRSAFSRPIPDNEELKGSMLSMRYQAAAEFNACNTKYLHAKDFADLVVGEELPKHLAAYFQQVEIIAKEILKGNSAYFTSERLKELAEKYKEIAKEARKELNIKNADCVVA